MRRRRDDALDLARIGLIFLEARPVDGDIAGRLRPELRRAGRHRRTHINGCGKLLVLDHDPLGRILCCEQGLRHYERHGLAHMHHALARERRPERYMERLAALAGKRRAARHVADAGLLHVRGSEYREHARRSARGLDIELADARVRMRRAHEHADALAGEGSVVHEAPAPAQERLVLDARLPLRMRGHASPLFPKLPNSR